jgi:cytochrome P450
VRLPGEAAVLGERLWSDPHAVFADLRERGAVHLVRMPDGEMRYMVVRYDECRKALIDTRLVSSAAQADGDPATRSRGARILRSMMITQDGAEHARLRRAVRPFFESGAVEWVAAGVDEQVRGLISSARPERIDIVSEVAVPLSAAVLRALLGISGAHAAAFESGLDDLSMTAGRSAGELMRAVRHAIADAAGHTDARGMLAWAAGQVDSAMLSLDEAIAMIVLMLYAGHVTTVLLLSYAWYHMLRSPSAVAALAGHDRRDAAAKVTGEVLRLESPIFPGLWRRAVADVELGGTRVPAGSTMLIAVASANRDGRRFIDPDTFAPELNRARHLSFGHGVHHCLGAGLARRVGESAIAEFFASGLFRRARLLDDGCVWTSTDRRGLIQLFVALDPEEQAGAAQPRTG